MSEVDISADAVQRLAEDFDAIKSYHNPDTTEHSFYACAAATLRALRDELSAMQKERDEDQSVIAVWRRRTLEAETRAEAAEKARDAHFAALPAAWRAGCDAAAGVLDGCADDVESVCPQTAKNDRYLAATIRALQPPADLAAATCRIAAECEAQQKLEKLAWEHAALLSKKSRMEYHINEALNQLRVSDSYAKEDRTHPRMPTIWEIQNDHVRDDLNNALNGI